MTGRSDRTVVRYCPPCAAGNHSHCTTRIGTRPGAECECGARAHDPVVEVAAQMARYVWGDHAAVLSVEAQASTWRRGFGVDR
jgi:hypothetical protein